MVHRPTCAKATYNAQKKRSMQPRWAARAIAAEAEPQLAPLLRCDTIKKYYRVKMLVNICLGVFVLGQKIL